MCFCDVVTAWGSDMRETETPIDRVTEVGVVGVVDVVWDINVVWDGVCLNKIPLHP